MLFRPLIWLRRIRYRRGYGVHSPFAFNLITDVIYQRLPYYQYQSLAEAEKRCPADQRYEPRKLKRLLFRLVNEVQPATIADVGRLSASALYMQAGCKRARYVGASDWKALQIGPSETVDFFYLHQYRQPKLIEDAFLHGVEHVTARSLLVVEGIGYSKEMRALWKRMQQHQSVGITFDLYDVGLLFFDRNRNKQHYIVNF